MSVTRRPDGRYDARIRVDGRNLKRTFNRRADAARWHDHTKADRDRGVHIDMTDKTTVAEYFQQWTAVRALRPGTRTRHRLWLKNHLVATPLGSRPLVRVRPSEVQSWAASRAAVVGPAAVADHVILLRAMFITAVHDGLIVRNPVVPSRISLPKAEKLKIVPLTVPQVRAWADAADPLTRAMILTQAMLGLRIGELLGLRVADVDFLRREVHITEQLDGVTGRRAPLKTAGSRRTIPLAPECGALLAGHIRQYPPGSDGFIFYLTDSRGRSDRDRHALAVQLRAEGLTFRAISEKLGIGHTTALRAVQVWDPRRVPVHTPMSRNAQWRRYRAAAEAAGLPPGTSSHELRHHFASVLLDGGESVHAVAERLGDTPQLVLETYGHMMPGREDTTRKAISAAWAGAAEQGESGTGS